VTAFVPVRIRLVTPISLWTTPAAVRPFAGSVLRMGWFLAAENRSLVMIVGSTPINPFTVGNRRASATTRRPSEPSTG
jgi:hypothetical protein